tara:strand:- start:11338 stop:11679 length:342 start_codon:yes stop_codon:yes gene_type:complete
MSLDYPTKKDFELGKKYLTNLKKYSEDKEHSHWDVILAEVFFEAVNDDDENSKSMNRLATKYFNSTPESQKLIDDVLTYVCGWRLHTLIGRVGQLTAPDMKRIDEEDEEDDDE